MSVLSIHPLGFPWKTFDPFLFCVHHEDHYPRGDARMAPDASLEGRDIGMDFAGKDGWSMYHGDVIPGFPRHPHRGFETVTLARRGFIDHSDSLGATARFGHGDCQWMTAGKGVVHSEMFPLVHQDRDNPTELFQIWLNLPAKDKLVEPHFAMLWDHTIPKVTLGDDAKTRMAIVAGRFGEHQGPPPPPSSWAADPSHEVAVWTLKMEPGATVTLPPASAGVNRTLYFFIGDRVSIAGTDVTEPRAVRVQPDVELTIDNGPAEAELLMLQGQPIGEPVAHHGPFVMNAPGELKQAFVDYHRTGFGGWPWDSDGPAHPREQGKFAIHADGTEEHVDAAE